VSELEKSVEDKFVKIAMQDYRCLALKFKHHGKKGGADRIIFCPNGHTFFIELKRPSGGEISEHQIQFKKDMEDFNKKVYFCDSLELALKILECELSYDLNLYTL